MTMRATGAIVTRSRIREVARQIAERFQPEKIILFGSYADGTPTADSDIDLLVVMETREKPLRAAAAISAAVEHPFPLDILVYRPADWAEYLREKAAFATHILSKGVVLHEARHHRMGRQGRG